MSRSTGKSDKTAQVFFFKKNERGAPVDEEELSLWSLSGSDEPEFPTEPFYMPDFLAQFSPPAQANAQPEELTSHKRAKRKSAKASQAKGERGPPKPKLSPEEARARSSQGRELFSKGRLAEARKLFESVVESGAPDAYAHRMLGTLYLSLGDRKKSLALFDAALRHDPQDLASYVYRGEIQLSRGHLDLAVADFAAAVRLGAADNPFVRRAGQLLKRVQASAASLVK
jgi:tetratricopeptide (TPR) repeat protein